jgi:hypothetical protein
VDALPTTGDLLAGAGEFDRAEAAGRAITDPDRQASALAAGARVMAVAGAVDRAGALVREAEEVAGSITDRYWHAHAVGAVAKALTAAGEYDRAGAATRSIVNPTGGPRR